MKRRYGSFAEFYPFYLSEHSNRYNRRLHFVGTALVIVTLVYTLATATWWMLVLVPVFGYGFAWVGHGFVERNRPATFSHPVYSLIGDFVMFKDILTGRVRL